MSNINLLFDQILFCLPSQQKSRILSVPPAKRRHGPFSDSAPVVGSAPVVRMPSEYSSGTNLKQKYRDLTG